MKSRFVGVLAIVLWASLGSSMVLGQASEKNLRTSKLDDISTKDSDVQRKALLAKIDAQAQKLATKVGRGTRLNYQVGDGILVFKVGTSIDVNVTVWFSLDHPDGRTEHAGIEALSASMVKKQDEDSSLLMPGSPAYGWALLGVGVLTSGNFLFADQKSAQVAGEILPEFSEYLRLLYELHEQNM